METNLLLIILCLVTGLSIAFTVIWWYQGNTLFSHTDVACITVHLIIFACLLTIIDTHITFPIYFTLSLLLVCTITDAVRSWLPFPVIIPTLLSCIWLTWTEHPWDLHKNILWGIVWGSIYGIRYLWYRKNNADIVPGSGDIFLVATVGVCSGFYSPIMITCAFLGHSVLGTLRHQNSAPFGPWLTIPLAVWLLYNF